MSFEDDLRKLEVDARRAPIDAVPAIKKAVGIAARKGKDAWRAAAGGGHLKAYPPSIDYDPVDSDLSTDVGPNPNRTAGAAGLAIVEDSPGGVHGAPQRNYVKAEQVIGPDLERGITIAIDQTLRNLGL